MERSGIYVEDNSRFTPYYRRYLWEPSLRWIPEDVHPNTISLVNHLVCWAVFVLGAIAPHVGPAQALAARCFAGIFVLASMILDALDGMHARRTGQTSRLGEVLDHWLDAINVPLVAGGLILALGLTGWLAVVGLIAGNMVYNAQLVEYHHHRAFVHPPTSGCDAQVIMSATFVVWGLAEYYFAGILPLHYAAKAFVVASMVLSLKMDWFYYPRLGRSLVLEHLKFPIFGFFVAALYLYGAVGLWAGFFWLMLQAFRINGTYVLRSVLGERYDGFDRISAFWLVLIAGNTLVAWLTGADTRWLSELGAWAACLHLGIANVVELRRRRPQLAPTR